jgi:GR25 family glycosyltransferase involved in LPS biosynthesis
MKAFVINLSTIESSSNSAKAVLEKLTEYGFDAELFEGTYGDEGVSLFKNDKRRLADYGIKTEEIPIDVFKSRYPTSEVPSSAVGLVVRKPLNGDPKFQKILRPGVIGCFYSHYRLWQKCIELNEPIFIFEDDVLFERGYIPVEWQDVILLCTGKQSYKEPFFEGKLFNPRGRPCTHRLPNTSMPGAVGYGITPQGATKLVEYYKTQMLPADTAMNQFVVKLECHSHLMGRAAVDVDGKESLTRSKRWGDFK